MLLKTHKCKLPVLPPTQTSECELFSRKFMQFESRSLCPLTECKKCPSRVYATDFLKVFQAKFNKGLHTPHFIFRISHQKYATTTLLNNKTDSHLWVELYREYDNCTILCHSFKKVALQPHTSSYCLFHSFIYFSCIYVGSLIPFNLPKKKKIKNASRWTH